MKHPVQVFDHVNYLHLKFTIFIKEVNVTKDDKIAQENIEIAEIENVIDEFLVSID